VTDFLTDPGSATRVPATAARRPARKDERVRAKSVGSAE
jgi:hypothetical protein